jgi:hypothetical protein
MGLPEVNGCPFRNGLASGKPTPNRVNCSTDGARPASGFRGEKILPGNAEDGNV